jgi:hypothetical protein
MLDPGQVLLLDHSDQIQIDDVKNSRIFIAACSTTLFIRRCVNCTFTVATRQFRTRDVEVRPSGCPTGIRDSVNLSNVTSCHAYGWLQNCYFFLYSHTEPIIELSSEVYFGPFNGAYPEHAEHLEQAGLDPSVDKWWKVCTSRPPCDCRPRKGLAHDECCSRARAGKVYDFNAGEVGSGPKHFQIMTAEEYAGFEAWAPLVPCEPAIPQVGFDSSAGPARGRWAAEQAA